MDNALQTLLIPNDNIPAAKDMPIIDDDAFDYQGYQVVRGEFFAHTYEPSFTFNQFKVSVNTACIRKLPNVEYVQILVNPEEKKLVVKPCLEEEKDSFRWCTVKQKPKQIKCTIFAAKIINLMNWNPNYRWLAFQWMKLSLKCLSFSVSIILANRHSESQYREISSK